MALEKGLKAWNELVIDGDRVELGVVERAHKPSVISRNTLPRTLSDGHNPPANRDDSLLALPDPGRGRRVIWNGTSSHAPGRKELQLCRAFIMMPTNCRLRSSSREVSW